MKRNWLGIGLVVVLVCALMFSIGFRVGHPNSGLRSAVGSAESSIVLYRQTEKLAAGDRVLVDIGDPELSPATSIIQSIDESSIVVQAGGLTVTVTQKEVKGKILALVPFIGAIFSVLG